MVSRVLLEVCVDDEAGARSAIAARADRLEVCSRLDLGGLTPRETFARLCRSLAKVPLMAMIRPRGGDFVYSRPEIAAMKSDIARLRSVGVDGFVFGALTRANEVDAAAVRELLDAARPEPVTFHRAFDGARDPIEALEALIDLGIERVLTSGGAGDALEGRATLARLVVHARGRVVVLAGGGVRARNARAIVEASGVVELHSSVPFDLRAAGLA